MPSRYLHLVEMTIGLRWGRGGGSAFPPSTKVQVCKCTFSGPSGYLLAVYDRYDGMGTYLLALHRMGYDGRYVHYTHCSRAPYTTLHYSVTACQIARLARTCLAPSSSRPCPEVLFILGPRGPASMVMLKRCLQTIPYT